MSTSLTLTPRYGRDYPSKAAVINDWNDGKDFTVADFFSEDDGRAVSIRESAALIASGKTSVHIRYKKLTQIAVIPIRPVVES
jgi:hypothetical protein